MAIARMPCALIRSIPDCVFSPMYSFTVRGAARHNRGEAAERQPLARTQGRNLDRCLTPNPTPCATGRHSSAHDAPRACDRMCGPRGIAACSSRSVQHDQGRRSENRPEAREGCQSEKPSQGEHPRTGGQRPKDWQADATLLRRSVSSRSCDPSPTCLRSATSSCISLQCSTRLSATSSFGLSHMYLVCYVGLLSAPPPLHCHILSLPHRSYVSSPRGHDIVDRFAIALARKVIPGTPTTNFAEICADEITPAASFVETRRSV